MERHMTAIISFVFVRIRECIILFIEIRSPYADIYRIGNNESGGWERGHIEWPWTKLMRESKVRGHSVMLKQTNKKIWPMISCFFENYFTFSTLHSVDKFLNEQQNVGLKKRGLVLEFEGSACQLKLVLWERELGETIKSVVCMLLGLRLGHLSPYTNKIEFIYVWNIMAKLGIFEWDFAECLRNVHLPIIGRKELCWKFNYTTSSFLIIFWCSKNI